GCARLSHRHSDVAAAQRAEAAAGTPGADVGGFALVRRITTGVHPDGGRPADDPIRCASLAGFQLATTRGARSASAGTTVSPPVAGRDTAPGRRGPRPARASATRRSRAGSATVGLAWPAPSRPTHTAEREHRSAPRPDPASVEDAVSLQRLHDARTP